MGGCPTQCTSSKSWNTAVSSLSCRDYNVSERAEHWVHWAAEFAEMILSFVAMLGPDDPMLAHLYSFVGGSDCQDPADISCQNYFLTEGCRIIPSWEVFNSF